MTKRRAGSSSIPDEEWERHKEEIVSLYRNSTRKRVMQLMSEGHGFHARYGSLVSLLHEISTNDPLTFSESQYTRVFKKWGLRRYSNARDWKRIDRCIRKRRSKGKASNVILYGNPISQDKLEKEIARNVSFTDRIFDAKGG